MPKKYYDLSSRETVRTLVGVCTLILQGIILYNVI